MITKEKYDLVVKLLKEGRTNREICKFAKISPNEITPIRKEVFGEGSGTGLKMKDKSICAQVFDLLDKKIPLTKIIVMVDIDPDEAMRLQDKYLIVSKKDRIVELLNDQDMDRIIEIVEFLYANPQQRNEIHESIDLQILNSNLKFERDEIKEEIKSNKIILKYFYNKIRQKQRQLGLEQV